MQNKSDSVSQSQYSGELTTGTTAYNWDFENRMVSVQLPTNFTVSFRYDPFGRRVEKGASVFTYDVANLIEESDVSGNAVAHYAFGTGIDEPLAAYRGAASAYFEADGLGSITSLSSLSGNVSDSFIYDSFGNLASSTGSFNQPFRYTGREYYADTELDYYHARYYDSSVGRFLSQDPVGFDAGINFYSYVGNDPVDDFDPTGLKKKRRRKPKPPICDAVFPHDRVTARLAELVFGEGNGTQVGDLAIASVVVNRANYDNPAEFGRGILGVINTGFQATGNALFNSVNSQAKVCRLNRDNCLRYKNAVLAATAAQAPDGTNTDALFYFDTSIAMPGYITRGIANGTIVPAPVAGSSNRITGTYGNPQIFFTYSDQ